MLPKSGRISRKSFDLLLKKGFLVSSPLFSARAVAVRPEIGTNCRFSVVVSKKTANKAYLRNRLRRVSYSVFEESGLKTIPGFCVAVFLKKPAVLVPTNKFRMELADFLRKIEVLCKKQRAV